MDHLKLRQEILAAAQSFLSKGLCVGRSGNLSARTDEGYLITPSGVFYDELTAAMILELDREGNKLQGDLTRSSEWRIHRDIYLERQEVNSIVHVHSPYATAVACTRRSIPAFHYEVALLGGDTIPCAEYATFGTEQLSGNALTALNERTACLLANHGQLALGENIKDAMNIAQIVEGLARQYVLSESLGGPVLLSEEEMRANLEKFKRYGIEEER